MEIKNKLTVTGGRGRGITEESRGRVKSRNMYKGPMDKGNSGGGRIECGRWGWWIGQRRVMGEK